MTNMQQGTNIMNDVPHVFSGVSASMMLGSYHITTHVLGIRQGHPYPMVQLGIALHRSFPTLQRAHPTCRPKTGRAKRQAYFLDPVLMVGAKLFITNTYMCTRLYGTCTSTLCTLANTSWKTEKLENQHLQTLRDASQNKLLKRSSQQKHRNITLIVFVLSEKWGKRETNYLSCYVLPLSFL